jgi:TetR/AcrR family transcriptional regulator, acrAB operon repressor
MIAPPEPRHVGVTLGRMAGSAARRDDEEDLAPTRRAEIGNESRKRILDAAERLFIERGVADTSFASIQREAGISRGSIPWHFDNKQGLLLAIIDRAMLLNHVDTSEFEGVDGIRQLLERTRGRLHEPQAILLAALLNESFRADSPTHERYRDWHAGIRESIVEVIEAAGDEVRLPPGVDAETYAAILFGTLIGLHLQWRLAPELVDLDSAIAALEILTVHQLGDPES